MKLFFLLLALISPVRAADCEALWSLRSDAVSEGGVSQFEGQLYQTLVSRHFMVHFSTRGSKDASQKARFAAERLDGLYDFLAARLKMKPETPIRAVLMPGQYGRSSVMAEKRAVFTGEKGEARLIVGSFFHELMHYFNLSVPDGRQDFWSGELSAQYYADCLSSGANHRRRFGREFAQRGALRDWSLIDGLHSEYRNLLDDRPQSIMRMGVSVFYFLEKSFGVPALTCFWKGRLDSKLRNKAKLWKTCFGYSQSELEERWRAYYGLRPKGLSRTEGDGEPRDGP